MCTKDIYKREISDVFVYILSYSTKSRYEYMSRRRLAFNNFALRYEKTLHPVNLCVCYMQE